MRRFLSFEHVMVCSLVLLFGFVLLSGFTLGGNSGIFQITIFGAFFLFWIGALWARILTRNEALTELCEPVRISDDNGCLHPFMKIGEEYEVLASLSPWGKDKGKLCVLSSCEPESKIFCVLAKNDCELPKRFRVHRQTIEDGKDVLVAYIFK